MVEGEQVGASEKESRAARSERIVARYKGGESLDEIGKDYGITRERVRQILKRANCPRRATTVTKRFLKTRRRPKKITDGETLRRLYEEEKLTSREIRKRLGTTNGAIYSSLDAHGIRRRSAAENILLLQKRPELTSRKLYELYVEKNLTAAAIAESYGYAPQTVKSRLSRLGIRKPAQLKEQPKGSGRSAAIEII